MKKLVLIYIFSVSLSVHFMNAQCIKTIDWVHPLPQGDDIVTIGFFEEQTGIAVTQNGGVLRTIDGGTTWTLDTTLYHGATSFVILNDSTGFIGGYMLFKTKNKGETWENVYSQSLEMTTALSKIDTIIYRGSYSGVIYKSDDLGENWVPLDSSVEDYPMSMTFITPNKGFVVLRNGPFLRTYDGGANWDTIHLPTPHSEEVYFATEEVGYVKGYGLLMKTTDSGETWSNLDVPFIDNISHFHFVNKDTGFVSYNSFDNNTIYKTTDGGLSWVDLEPVKSTNNRWYNAIMFLDENNGYAVGRFGIIINTTDGGDNWSVSTENNTQFLYDIQWINENELVICGEEGSIFHSLDKGENWNVLRSDTLGTFKAIKISNDSTWFVTGFKRNGINYAGFIYKTNNRGSDWEKVFYIDNKALLDIVEHNDSLYCIGEDILLLSDSSGVNWEQREISSTDIFKKIKFIDKKTAFCLGQKTILKSEDGAKTWTTSLVYDSPSVYFNDLEVLNDSTLICVGSNKIFLTKDQGSTWGEIDHSRDLTRVKFFDDTYGIAVGYDNALSYTCDGGNTWNFINVYSLEGDANYSSVDLFSLEYLDLNNLLLVGKGSILMLKANFPEFSEFNTFTDTVCLGKNTYEINAEPSITYNWKINGGTIIEGNNTYKIIEWDSPGNSSISITPMSNCCIGKEYVFPVFVKDYTQEKPEITVDEMILTSSYTIGNQWYFENEPIEGANDVNYTAYHSGYYSVMADDNGCKIMSDDVYIVITGKENLIREDSIKIYPIPASDYIYLENNTNKKIVAIRIFNFHGQMLYNYSYDDGYIDLSSLESGTYFLEIVSDGTTLKRKIIIYK